MKKNDNNVGLLRLILASLVIIGHAPEIIDGDRHREPMTVLFHSLSLGECAVDGFFLISGFLIAKSMVRTAALAPFTANRFARIYPGFVVSYLLCVVCLAPWVGAQPWRELGATVANLVLLKGPPPYAGQLQGLAYPVLNGAAWTIQYEFRCYMLVGLLWLCGLLQRRRIVLSVTLLAAILAVASNLLRFPSTFGHLIPHADLLLGAPDQDLRLTSIFLLGVSTFLYWDEIAPRLNGWVAALSAILLLVALPLRPVADVAFGVLGGPVIFWLCFRADLGPLKSINNRWDISYGAYLYGWPIATLILYAWPGVTPTELAGLSLCGALAAGALSWFLVERWAKDALKHIRWPSPGRPVPSPVLLGSKAE